MRRQPLLLAIALLGVGWASGGGAAQILFSLFGEIVFNRGPAGIGIVWAAAGCRADRRRLGGPHRLGPRLSFNAYKRTVAICYLVARRVPTCCSASRSASASRCSGLASRARPWRSAPCCTGRCCCAHVGDEFRGRVFATNESLVWATMMLSMLAAGLASQSIDPR